MNELESLMCLNAVSGLGGVKIRRLCEAFGSASAVWKVNGPDLKNVAGIGDQIAANMLTFDRDVFLKQESALLHKHQVRVLTLFDDKYPVYLKETVDSPIVLYLRGQWMPEMFPGIAIVGCRRASFYGLSVARSLAVECAGYGLTVVSGMARGIDTAAHDGCINANGVTVAVLGSGLACIYPRENKRLFDAIARNGCVISEFPMSTGPLASNFPRRNRIISGLSFGVVVVEAAARSGALITSQCALEQGRDVFAVPGKVGHPQAAGTNRLIQQGAKLIFELKDVLVEFPQFSAMLKPSIGDSPVAYDLSIEEKKVFNVLSDEPIYIDDIVVQSGLEAQDVMGILVNGECQGWVKRLPGGYFVKISR